MNKKEAKQYAGELLDRLKDIDRTTVEAYYEMGRLLSAMEAAGLWEILGYKSITHMINEELSFSGGAGWRYIQTYRHFRRLKYNKREAIKLMQQYSFTSVSRVISQFKDKKGVRAIKNAIDIYNKNHKQVNFMFTEEEWLAVRAELEAAGAIYDEEHDKLFHSSEALLIALGLIREDQAA